MLVFPDAHVADGAESPALDLGRFREDEPGAAHRELREVREVPFVDETVDWRVLRHRRDDDAVSQRDAADLQRRKEFGRGLLRSDFHGRAHRRGARPSSALAMMLRWIWLVPSTICSTLASRM